jgi:hypothetical protein
MSARISAERVRANGAVQWLVLGLAVCLAGPVLGQNAFENYVQRCKSELDFETIPRFDCRGLNFRPRTDTKFFQVTNDWVAYRRVTDKVDAVFACRWVKDDEGSSRAASGEMIVHNRQTGGTCFFELRTEEGGGAFGVPSTYPVSPTHVNAVYTWEELGRFNRVGNKICTECHAAGPYIASPQIADELARFGLMNDGHDTFNTKYYPVIPGADYKDPAAQRKFTLPIDNATAGCAAGCHVIANQPLRVQGCGPDHAQWPLCESPNNVGNILMPGINVIIDDILKKKNVMPPTSASSHYRWINRGSPRVAAQDFETLAALRVRYPKLTCDKPSYMQARRVDSSIVLNSNDFRDKLQYFDLQNGLMCLDIDNIVVGGCRNYQTRYKCDGEWTPWRDSPQLGVGDFEPRSTFQQCAEPTDIQARYLDGGEYKVVYGPRDRLRTFNKETLECRNEDQDDGQCSNYSVRYVCP